MSQVECVLPASNALYAFESGRAKEESLWSPSSPIKRAASSNQWREDGVSRRKRSRRSRRPKKSKVSRRVTTKTCDWHPAAPYNTNEFLMEEHDDLQESDLEGTEEGVTSNDTDTERKETENDEAFFDKEFSSTYDDVRAERLHDMSKNQLISEYLQLEDRVDRLERRLKELGVPAILDTRPKLFATPRHELETPVDLHLDGDKSDDEDDIDDVNDSNNATHEKIRIFEQEIATLELENRLLGQQYNHLQGVYTSRPDLCWCSMPSSSPPPSSSSSRLSGPSSPSSSSDSSSSSSSSSSSGSDSEGEPTTSSDSESDSADSISTCSTECSCCHSHSGAVDGRGQNGPLLERSGPD